MARSCFGLVIAIALLISCEAARAQVEKSTVAGKDMHSDTGFMAGKKTVSRLLSNTSSFKQLSPLAFGDSLATVFNSKSSFKLPLKGIEQQWSQGLSRINLIKDEAKKVLTNPVSLSRAEVNYMGYTDNSYAVSYDDYFFNNSFATTHWTIAGIPLEVSYRNEDWTATTQSQNNITVRFDRDVYLEALKKKLAGAIDPSQFLDQLKDPLATIKQTALADLQTEFAGISKKYNGLLGDKIKAMGDPASLFTKDVLQLRDKLLNPAYLEEISEQQMLLMQLIQQRNNGLPVDAAQIQALENTIRATKGVEELVNKVEQQQQKWKASGLLAKMKEWDVLRASQLTSFLNNPSTIGAIAKKKLNLSGLQRLLLKVNKINAGRHAASVSPLSLQHLLTKGISTEFLNNNKYLLLFSGKINNNMSIWDVPFGENMNSPAGTARAIRIGKGNPGSNHSHISIMSFEQSFQSFYNSAPIPVTWKSLVTTIGNQMHLGENGSVNVEISRSATNFSNQAAGASGMEKIFSGNDLMSNMAFSLRYEDEHPDLGLNYQVHVSHTSRGYDNPGNPYLNNGGSEAGYRLRKSFLKNKLQFSLRTDLREYRYTDEPGNKWSNTYSVMDLKWRVKKGQFITIRYMPNRMKRVTNGDKQNVSTIDRLSAETSISGKLWGAPYRNYVSIAYQGNEYAMGQTGFRSRSMVLSSFQSVAIGKKLLYVNTTYNNSSNNSAFAYFNSSVMAEAGFTYQLFRGISGSSAIVYNAVEGWYQQGGIRQTLSGQLSSRFNVNVYVDARNNFRLYQPLITGPVRADISLQYLFKK
jgi:hypothetical protein